MSLFKPATDSQAECSRRRFLTSSASGLGTVALAHLLERDGVCAAADNPMTARPPHFEPRAKQCVFIFLAGGTSQVELFDPKPTLNRLTGTEIPESFRKGIRLGQTGWHAPLMGSRFGFRRYGECGMELGELLPQIGSCADDIALIRSMHHEAFDHAPGELELSTGHIRPGERSRKPAGLCRDDQPSQPERQAPGLGERISAGRQSRSAAPQ